MGSELALNVIDDNIRRINIELQNAVWRDRDELQIEHDILEEVRAEIILKESQPVEQRRIGAESERGERDE